MMPNQKTWTYAVFLPKESGKNAQHQYNFAGQKTKQKNMHLNQYTNTMHVMSKNKTTIVQVNLIFFLFISAIAYKCKE